MDNILLRKVFRNKKNNQLSFTLPRKLLSLQKKKKLPKEIEIKINKIIWK